MKCDYCHKVMDTPAARTILAYEQEVGRFCSFDCSIKWLINCGWEDAAEEPPYQH